MKNIHLILIIAILILIYLISMQWLGGKRTTFTTVDSRPMVQEQIETPMPLVVVETAVTDTPVTETPTPELTATIAEEVKTGNTTETQEAVIAEEKDTIGLVEYKNTNYGYSFSMSDQMYYAGFGSRDGAVHTLAIQPDALPETFETATIRVYYYGKKTLPELVNSSQHTDPKGKYILLLLDDAYSVKIESDNMKSPTVQAIISTIKKT